MFKKILVLHKKGLSKRGFSNLRNLKYFLKDKNVEIVDYRNLNLRHLKDKDLVISFGGDGTFVRAANLIENSAILGINADSKVSEGFLTTISGEEIEKLKEIFEGKFKIVEWQRAKVILNGRELKEKAINEVFVGSALQYETARYSIIYRGKKEEQRSSGIIVATGAGSSAWFKSAGGKEFSPEEKKLKFIVREPYFGKKLFNPKILDGEILEGEKLIIKSYRKFNGIITINEAVYNFNIGSVAEISLSDKPLKVVEYKN